MSFDHSFKPVENLIESINKSIEDHIFKGRMFKDQVYVFILAKVGENVIILVMII